MPVNNDALPTWICIPPDSEAHLTYYSPEGLGGCAEHPIADGQTAHLELLAPYIHKEAIRIAEEALQDLCEDDKLKVWKHLDQFRDTKGYTK